MDKPWLKDFVTMEDGYKWWFPESLTGGGLSAHTLRQIADDLDKANEAWDKQVKAYFAKELFPPKLHHRIWQDDGQGWHSAQRFVEGKDGH